MLQSLKASIFRLFKYREIETLFIFNILKKTRVSDELRSVLLSMEGRPFDAFLNSPNVRAF